MEENIVNVAIRLPIGVYNEIKKIVEEDHMALSCSGYCRQIIVEDVTKRMKARVE